MVACEDEDTPSKSDFDIEYDASIARVLSTTRCCHYEPHQL